MSIGPVQLVVLGFRHPHFHGEIIAELERLRESDTVRVIDAFTLSQLTAGHRGPQRPASNRTVELRDEASHMP